MSYEVRRSDYVVWVPELHPLIGTGPGRWPRPPTPGSPRISIDSWLSASVTTATGRVGFPGIWLIVISGVSPLPPPSFSRCIASLGRSVRFALSLPPSTLC